MSTGVPSSRCGMSSIGVMREMTPLLPWRPAILSPGCSLRFTATNTLTIFITPGGSSSPRCSFSTLSSKRLRSASIDSSKWAPMVSISAMIFSSATVICRHWPGVSSCRSASVILAPVFMPFGPLTDFRPTSRSFRRV